MEWWLGVAALCAVGLGIRLAYALVFRPHLTLWGDPLYYHRAANLLVTGHGFINPVAYTIDPHHRVVQGADFPPLFSVVLAGASLVGFKSVFAHQIWCAIIGTATVAVVALAGREVAGRRAGLIAALVAAAYPNFWINDGLIHAETLSLFLVALSVLVAYRLWRRPRILTAGVLGAVLALAILTRDEEALLVPLVLVPLTLLARSRPR
ncbi:MAG: glycosyltransferase family 39 protein, partial [Acidimicrobiales bacterium]